MLIFSLESDGLCDRNIDTELRMKARLTMSNIFSLQHYNKTHKYEGVGFEEVLGKLSE